MPLKRDLLLEHLAHWSAKLQANPERTKKEEAERLKQDSFYRSFSDDRMKVMSREDLYEYLARLWAMKIWGNKSYVVDQLLQKHNFDEVRRNLRELVWGKHPLALRWDTFRAAVSGLGPAMMSEMLCHAHPDENILWNRRAYVALRYLGVAELPRYNYQMTGERYSILCNVGGQIADDMRTFGLANVNLLTVDYFIWDELQVEENLSNLHPSQPSKKVGGESAPNKVEDSELFLHDEVKNKLAEIGTWLGFKTDTEVKVADGSVVDAIWQATIGNMGRVIYVFEVQTKGSIDSLIINLLKSLNNPAVQGVVAVSDKDQIEKIRKHAGGVKQLFEKLKYWDYQEVLEVHDSLEGVNEAINTLGLVPQGFGEA